MPQHCVALPRFPGLSHQLLSPWPAQHLQSGSFTPDHPIPAIPTLLLALLQVRQAFLEIKLTRQTFRSNFKAKLFNLPLTPAHNNLQSVVLKKIPAENNLKFLIEKYEETQKMVGKKMRWFLMKLEDKWEFR